MESSSQWFPVNNTSKWQIKNEIIIWSVRMLMRVLLITGRLSPAGSVWLMRGMSRYVCINNHAFGGVNLLPPFCWNEDALKWIYPLLFSICFLLSAVRVRWDWGLQYIHDSFQSFIFYSSWLAVKMKSEVNVNLFKRGLFSQRGHK